MGTARNPDPVRLFLAVMHRPGAAIEDALAGLIAAYGPLSLSCGPVAFDFSDYYAGEMGADLVKSYHVFERDFDRSQLPSVKLRTNDAENRGAVGGKRVINLDPGYLSRDKLVLASTKDFYHRLYLGDGIYGEVTLHYRQGEYRFFSWTYADYRQACVLEMLEKARAALVGHIRRRSGHRPSGDPHALLDADR